MPAGKNKNVQCFRVRPFFFSKKFSGYEGKEQAIKSNNASKKQMKGNYKSLSSNTGRMNDLRNNILTFRDLLDLSPCIASATVTQLMIWTMKDVCRSYTIVRPSISMSELERSSIFQVLNSFCGVLKSIGDLWTNNGQWMAKSKYSASDILVEQGDLEQQALAMLEDMNTLARERMFDMMDEDGLIKGSTPSECSFRSSSSEESYSDSPKTSVSSSPATPTSVLPDFDNVEFKGKRQSYAQAQPLLLPQRLQAVEKLNPIDLKRLSFHIFSHVVAQDPSFLNQKVEIQRLKTIGPQTNDRSDVASTTFEMGEEISETLSDDGDWTSVRSAERPSEMLEMDDYHPPRSLPRLTSKETQGVTPPPPKQSAFPSPIAAPPAPSPPPLPMLSTKTFLSQQAPPLESILQAQDIPQNLKTGQPLPTLSPPLRPIKSVNTMVLHLSPPPPPLVAGANAMLPSPPSPIVSSNPSSSSTMSFSPHSSPPKTSISTMPFSPPPPPPPPPPLPATPTTSRITTRPPPPPLPTIPTTSRITTRPPSPPTSALGKITSPPNMSAENTAPLPPPPTIGTMNRGVPVPPPPMPMKIGDSHPPSPTPGGVNSLRPKRAVTKLKRSSHMGNMYRFLKRKVEGTSLEGKTSKKGKIRASSGGKQGMADALAEMTKRSTYFQQIEEDVKNHAKSIRELKVVINSFINSDMIELQNFHKHVESHLEKLTDETQVLSRFEDFPTKKLEGLRMAAALYSKLADIVTTLQNWRIESPVNQVLDNVEKYFDKIKVHLDTLERNKDEESKKFQSQKIHFDFSILMAIKELMVDVSSGCMELALQETREAKGMEKTQNGIKYEGGRKKVLWSAFQFAYRVYTFAGGYDDRADRLTRELANEIEIEDN